MRTRDRIAPLAASASMLVCAPLLPSHSSSTLRPPILQAHAGRVIEREASVNRAVLSVTPHRHAGAVPMDAFTTRDLAVLNAVDGVRAQDDDLDYTGLFNYDDD